MRLLESGVVPKTVLDVGANEGQFAIGALATFPKATIHCFEPGGNARERLTAEMQENNRVQIHGVALGQENGEAVLHVTSQDQSSSILSLHANHLDAYPDVTETRTENIRISTLSTEWGRLNPTSPVLLKIDTQGFEMKVLIGAEAVLSKIRWIVLETCTRPMYQGEKLFSEITAWLGERGFEFRGPVEIHFTPKGKMCQFDALFENLGAQDI